MKKILFYTDTPMLGGTENQMLTLAKFLPKEKYPVTLACSKYTSLNPWCQQWIEAGFEVIRFPVAHKHDPRHYLYLKKISRNFDIVHVHLWNPACARYSFFALKNKPLVITEHDPFVLSGLKGWIKKTCNRRLQAVIVASQASKQMVLEQDPSLEERLHIIPHGLDNEAWDTEYEKVNADEVRAEELGLKKGDIAIMCIAELHERKGQQYLIEAFAGLAKDYPHVKLFLVGRGPQEHEYKLASLPLGEQIRFMGRRKDIPKLLKACDIFVLPSRREGFGLVILEASLAGKPIIGSRVGGIQEIIRDGETGLLVTPENSKEIQEALRALIENSLLRTTMGSTAREYVLSQYTARQMADATSLIYDRL